MKFLKFILLAAMLHGYPSCSMGQTTDRQLEFNSAWGVDYESNMVKNPSAAKNLNDTLKLGATLARDNSAGNKIDGKASFLLDSSALNDYLELSLLNPSDEQTSGNCGFKGLFKGDARLYRAQILDGSSNVLAQTVPLTNETGFREFRVWYPCGASGARKVRITQTEAGTAPAINVGKFYYGRMEPGAGTSPNTFTAKVSATGIVSNVTPPGWLTNFSVTDIEFTGTTFKSGLFTQTPNCIAVVDTSSGANFTYSIRTYNTTTSTIGVSSNSVNSTTAAPFTISCTKTGSDYVQPAITPDQTDKPYTSFTPVLSTGALATGGNQKYWYMLDGPNMIMYFEYEPGTNTGTIGSGNYLITIPGGYSISSTIATPTGSVTNFGSVYVQLASGAGQSRTGSVTAWSATQVAIRLNNGSTNDTAIWGSATGPLNVAQVRIGFTAIIPIAGRENIRSSNAPLLLGSVTSDAPSAVKIEYGGFLCGTSSVINANSGGFSAISNAVDNGTTRSCDITLKSGYSSPPRCTATNISPDLVSNPVPIAIAAGATTSNVTVMGPDSNFNFNIQCIGPR